MIVLEALQRLNERQGRPAGVWRNRFWLPSELPLPRQVWGPGDTLGVYEWPSRDIAETKAAEWLAYIEAAGWIERYGRPRYLGAIFCPARVRASG